MARDEIHTAFISYEQAQKLIPVFRWYIKNAPWRTARHDASVIIMELENVRNIDYSPLPGYQLIVSERQLEFLHDVMNEVL